MRWRLAALLALAACSAHARTRVLFIGNSLTAANDLPAMVGKLADAAGTPLLIDSVVLPGASLEDHLADGTAARRLASSRWDFVILQQGPSALPESRVALRRDAARFAELARASGARPVLYMVWPARARSADFDAVRESYALAAADVGGLLAPGGEAWRAAWKMDPTLALYGPDNLHPTPAGSYLAALVITSVLTSRSAVGMPDLDIPRASLLQRAADTTRPPSR